MPLKCPIFCLRFGIDERSHVKTAKSLNEVTAGENCVTFHTVMLCAGFFQKFTKYQVSQLMHAYLFQFLLGNEINLV